MDLADAHYRALEFLEENKSGIFNLGNGDGFSVKEIIETCREITGKRYLQLNRREDRETRPVSSEAQKKPAKSSGGNQSLPV